MEVVMLTHIGWISYTNQCNDTVQKNMGGPTQRWDDRRVKVWPGPTHHLWRSVFWIYCSLVHDYSKNKLLVSAYGECLGRLWRISKNIDIIIMGFLGKCPPPP